MIDYSILIPAYNTGHTLPTLLTQIKELKHQPNSVWVIDDGSTDQTHQVLRGFAVSVIKLDHNQGKGFALRKGFEIFLSEEHTHYLICLDADLQHPVSYIDQFLYSVRSGPIFLIGSRKRNLRAMPIFRIFSNTITSFILSAVTRQKIEDSQCGFRLIDRESLKRLELKENGFQLESEMIIQAAKLKIPIAFVAIPTIYNGNVSHIHHFTDTYRFLKLVINEIFGKK